MSRETRTWGELPENVYIIDDAGSGDEVRHVVKAHTAGGRTAVIFDDTAHRNCDSRDQVELATEEEIAAHLRQQDRLTFVAALNRLGSRILDRELPVPPGGRGVWMGFDLTDDKDLLPWAEYLSTRPQRGTSRPQIRAEAEGVEVYVYGPGNTSEFGPDYVGDDLADVAVGTVEHEFGPMYAERNRLTDEAEAALEDGHDGPLPPAPKPAPVGWPLGDGHRPTPPPEAMLHDRYDEKTES